MKGKIHSGTYVSFPRIERAAKLVILASCMALALSSQGFAQGGTWATKAPMPTPRIEPGVGVVNGIVYAVGGTPATATCSYSAANEAYDPRPTRGVSRPRCPPPGKNSQSAW